VAAGAHESQEIIAADIGRSGIFERVAVNCRVFHQSGVDHDADALIGIADEAEGGDGSGCHAEYLHQQIGLSKTEAGALEHLGQGLEVDPRRALGDDQNQSTLGVFQEQVFGVTARYLAV